MFFESRLVLVRLKKWFKFHKQRGIESLSGSENRGDLRRRPRTFLPTLHFTFLSSCNHGRHTSVGLRSRKGLIPEYTPKKVSVTREGTTPVSRGTDHRRLGERRRRDCQVRSMGLLPTEVRPGNQPTNPFPLSHPRILQGLVKTIGSRSGRTHLTDGRRLTLV